MSCLGLSPSSHSLHLSLLLHAMLLLLLLTHILTLLLLISNGLLVLYLLLQCCCSLIISHDSAFEIVMLVIRLLMNHQSIVRVLLFLYHHCRFNVMVKGFEGSSVWIIVLRSHCVRIWSIIILLHTSLFR